jgi:hypothetical protein
MKNKPKPDMQETQRVLWDVNFPGTEDDRADQLMQMYMQYLNMADRISDRRGTANSFFLTLNTGIVGAYATFNDSIDKTSSMALLAMLIALMSVCVTWAWLLRSYRTLNRAKFAVVGMLEKRLPASPFDAEWVALGKSGSWWIHAPLTPIELFVPLTFFSLYAVYFIALVVTG